MDFQGKDYLQTQAQHNAQNYRNVLRIILVAILNALSTKSKYPMKKEKFLPGTVAMVHSDGICTRIIDFRHTNTNTWTV